MLAARVHTEASVSSPTLRFYQPGTALQVISRENGWVQVTNPTSQKGGWVFEQYLGPLDRAAIMQTAMAPTTYKALSEPTQANPVPSAKKRSRAPRPVVRVPREVAKDGGILWAHLLTERARPHVSRRFDLCG